MYTATKFQASSPDAMANGQVIMPYIQVLTGTPLEYLIDEKGVRDVQADKFYPQQIVCDMQSKISEQAGLFSGELTSIGRQSIESIGFPDEVNSIEAALNMLHQIYQAIHQNIPAEEGWGFERVSDTEMKITFNSPYEQFAAYGYIYGIAHKFAPDGLTPDVYMEDESGITTFRVVLEAD